MTDMRKAGTADSKKKISDVNVEEDQHKSDHDEANIDLPPLKA